jgi:glycerophosphoryl diester phosphodiesterase
MIRQVIASLRRLKAIERVSIELFSIKTKMGQLMRRLEPNLTTGHTRSELVRFVAMAKIGFGWRFRRRGFAIEMPPRRNRLAVSSKRTLRAAARRGIPMFVWTVNNEKDMRRFLDWGAAGLFTDHPDALRLLVDTGNWDKRKG